MEKMERRHEGHHMGGPASFQTTNMGLSHDFWYIIVAVVGFMALLRLVNLYKARSRLQKRFANSVQYPTKPSNQFLEIWATITALIRESSYPQLYVPSTWFSWMTPPPLGRVITLLVYWAIIISMMTANAIKHDAFFWERLGFRNAWITIMQMPLLYLLASKCSIIGLIVGTSHERLNWLHRWVGRTMFVTGAVHGWYFFTEWQRADIVDYQMKMMTTVKYGFGAWAILGWSLIAGFAPLRRLGYEFFVLQHLVSAILFIWLVYRHIPKEARWNVWFSIGALCFDRACRTILLVWQNVKFRPNRSKCKGGQRIGHFAQIRAVGDSITVINIKDVHFRWKAGQHLYLWLPAIGPMEAHPYTIACAHQLPETCICNSIQLVVRKHGGFSKRLHERALKDHAEGKKGNYTVFVSGPYGMPPRLDIYETVILISASTGASFTLPILEDLLANANTNCIKRIDFLLTTKQGEEIDFYVKRLHEFLDKAKEVGVELLVHVAITRSGRPDLPPTSILPTTRDRTEGKSSSRSSSTGPAATERRDPEKRSSNNTSTGTTGTTTTTTVGGKDIEETLTHRRPLSESSTDSHVHHSTTRPDIAAFIRGPVEATGGETKVVVCGGPSLVARVRNCVAALADERAVHKGTGAQGIGLFVEEYSF
ncbi:FAD-binding domain-containing protein [Sordaria brevicollis]|uniref:ferric-chelate reductase (NADPH) n=1 Tax=Sordaria brevicollis TaxID=83679 RepID=A0AAE0UCL4_SORBR|nr:FAD-binding domain-containing protein [Sordaria brevicollis]